MAVELQQYKSEVKPDWCPGCGDFAVLSALTKALQVLALPPWQVLVVSGIGCSSNLPGFLSTYGFHGIHGRALPVASGAKLANPELTVIATGGDGDGYGIGAGHFLHSMRRNLDITYLVMNNEIYGLTTGQASPTNRGAAWAKATEWPNLEGKRDRVPTGVFFEADYPTYEELDPSIRKFGNPTKQKLGLDNPDELLKEFY